MEDDAFISQLDRFYRNLDALLEEHASKINPSDEVARARQELMTFVEELRVAMEELSRQNEELQEARNRVEAERSRYRDLFEFAPDGYIITDKDATIQEANWTVAEMLNVPSRYLIRKPLATYIYEEDRK
jgi:PAS domain-containing protein